MKRWTALFIHLVFLIGSASHAQAIKPHTDAAKTPAGWSHSLEIYAFALNIRGDSRIGNISTDLNVDPSFIMDHLDMGAMLRLEGIYQDHWGYYIDYSFMELSGDSDAVLDKDLNLLKGDADIRQGVLEAKAFKRYHYHFGSIDYMAGIRWWDNDINANLFTSGGRVDIRKSLDDDWVDYLIGVRWIHPINKQWRFHASADVGLSADTNFTSGILTGAYYRMSHWAELNIAYKSTWVDYDNGDDFAYDTASQGFLLGVVFHF
ncbi:hypothetical protein ACFFLZ_05455 [Photobacterium aphoticum]|uniref:Outer membrane protein beta-barrel domain-containing protein n=1 Tax=Photobacterium aphoticum TaxID=754436 RepID=A0A0J1GR03_9GAMM|nr:hypothetical protein [Photobacterium aphoticum]KLV01844.1 hypothetical protein ABT58_05360 [Photobacterium aphoticum]PSU60074.1 hypothetical protein C9I90_00120 [Photobacterium aphoticum]GHA32983.1 hypothetical protein GCM10007086_02720 [Photobacterium aphoticum]